MPLKLNALERALLLKLNQGPGPAVDLFGALAFHVVFVALKMKVFEALGAAPSTAPALAERLGMDERGVRVLLEALEPLGYVHAREGRNRNTAMTTKWLLRSSPQSFAAFLEWWGDQVLPFWDLYLEEGLRRGGPPITIYDWLDQRPGGWQVAQAGFEAVARQVADEVVARLEIPPSARRLLDVGGGHGLYAVALCRRHPGLSATVFDLPQVLQAARNNIQKAGLGDRIAVQAGDFRKEPLGEEYDVVLLFNIIHAYPPEENVELFRKVARALRPGGVIVILDQLKGRTPGSLARAAAGLLAVAYLANLGGQTYAYEDIRSWLLAAGLSSTRRIGLWKSLGNNLVLAARGEK